MKADVVAGILAALPSDVAQKVTVELANRYKASFRFGSSLGASGPSSGSRSGASGWSRRQRLRHQQALQRLPNPQPHRRRKANW